MFSLRRSKFGAGIRYMARQLVIQLLISSWITESN